MLNLENYICFIKNSSQKHHKNRIALTCTFEMENCVSKTWGKGQRILKNSQKVVTIFNLKKHSKFKILSANGKV